MTRNFLDVAGTREILSSVGAAPACMVRKPCVRAVSGLRPGVQWPPARSWLTVAAPGESPRCGRKRGSAPRRERRDGAPEGVARLCKRARAVSRANWRAVPPRFPHQGAGGKTNPGRGTAARDRENASSISLSLSLAIDLKEKPWL